jgi:ADP-ribose pyrophosphatase YjhB (NUDIX family)
MLELKQNIMVTLDVVPFFFRNGELRVVLNKRKHEPFIDQYALPGVIVNGLSEDSDIEDAMKRLLRDKMPAPISYMEKVDTVGDAKRDPRGWSISIVYMAFIPNYVEGSNEDLESFSLVNILSGENELPFDHNKLVGIVAERFANKSMYTSMPLMALQADSFTLNDVVDVYKSLPMGGSVKDITVRKRLEFLESKGNISIVGQVKQGKGRPSKLYSRDNQLHVFDRSILS